ncbi:hypothetical protein ACWEJ6_21175 [Nonomuraea sp. NPDC004702]
MSAFDMWAARLVRAPWADTAPAAPAVVSEVAESSPMLTTYADTVLEVEAAELDVVADLDRLTAGGLSPWEACAALFGATGAEAGDGSDGTGSSGPQKAATGREEASPVSL